MPSFSHLHVHSQYSLLDGAANIRVMMEKAKQDGMRAVALTDHGNMFGAFQFVAEADKVGVIPVVGCEFYVVEDRHKRSFGGGTRDVRFHQLLLAKNQTGYHNLSKLCSLGYMEGLYSKYPRVDKELIMQYKEGLIATTCCIGASVPQTILKAGEEAGEKVFKEWWDMFGDDYFIELQRHGLQNIDGSGLSQEDINQILLKWSRKYNVPVIATNDSHYVEEDDWNAHDILLCVNTGDKQSTPKGYGKGYRFGFPNSEFYFKTQAEMNALFHDIPEALDNTNLIIDRITPPELKRDILLPNYVLPEGFKTQDDYLRHLTYEGAMKRYGEITSEITERLDYELKIIKEMGFPGYFLIVQDFTSEAVRLGVSVGPGRGSAAGSAVAYCVGITNIDPIKYKLLFERFLNPERVSMPDIDIDFDDEGRSKIIDYVVEKYGKNQVAQIITYGSMAAKSSIRDVGRVLDLPLSDTDRLSKMVPDISLGKVFGADMDELSKKVGAEGMEQVKELRKIAAGDDLAAQTLVQARKLEGSVRNTGMHACGIIITPDDITKYIPVCTSKDSDLLITQFDNKVVEDAGMLKMDFLGLKTLTIIKDAIKIIKNRHGVEIDPDTIPLDDETTYGLYQRGETNGTFQFESGGMQKHLRELKPNNIEDLIAMNALYRPGPMQYIETFIARKHGREEVEYGHELLEGLLKDTYGIMVYQEQIMQTAQVLAGYSLGEADLLRRAMGKKKMDVMQQQSEIFVAGANKLHDIPQKQAKDIFNIMMKFAEYGFNRSHSAAYSVVAFQTGYLKANYPAEYMASVLTNNMSDIKKVTFFMEECRRMELKVFGPDVNESAFKFVVNQKGEIRFGLGALKGVGEGAVDAIVNERAENGPYRSIFDVTKRIDMKAANKKTLESMALGGAFDSFEGVHRAQYFAEDLSGSVFLEKAIRFGASYQESQRSSQVSLFGEASSVEIPEPDVPMAEEWGTLEKLSREKDVVGIYISGHPLDDFKLEMDHFCNTTVSVLNNPEAIVGKEVKLAGMVTAAAHRMTKKGKPFGTLQLEDYTDSYMFFLFSDDYLKFKQYLVDGWFLFLQGRFVKNKWDDTRLEFKIGKVELLTELRDKLASGIDINMELSRIDDKVIEEIYELVSNHKGGCKLKFNVYHKEERLAVDMMSKTLTVSLDNEFIDKLDRFADITYKLHT